jgi:transcriptional regulator
MESCRWSGAARTIEEPAWLLRQIGAMTGKNGSSRAELWAVEDAPPGIVAAQKRGIVGIGIAIETIDGKWKVSQNRPLAARQGVA